MPEKPNSEPKKKTKNWLTVHTIAIYLTSAESTTFPHMMEMNERRQANTKNERTEWQ